jgi:putative hydrolase of HD superfamily
MHDTDLDGILQFMRSAERMKTMTRTSWTSTGKQESVAEHTWRLAMLALVLEHEFPEIDMGQLLRMCIVHDLGEAVGGDISATLQPPEGKATQERMDLVQLIEPLPSRTQEALLALWDEYEAGSTPVARVAKALDKLETIMQHNQGANPDTFDYAFNLGYGQRYTTGDPRIEAIREWLDRDTQQRMAERNEVT